MVNAFFFFYHLFIKNTSFLYNKATVLYALWENCDFPDTVCYHIPYSTMRYFVKTQHNHYPIIPSNGQTASQMFVFIRVHVVTYLNSYKTHKSCISTWLTSFVREATFCVYGQDDGWCWLRGLVVWAELAHCHSVRELRIIPIHVFLSFEVGLQSGQPKNPSYINVLSFSGFNTSLTTSNMGFFCGFRCCCEESKIWLWQFLGEGILTQLFFNKFH